MNDFLPGKPSSEPVELSPNRLYAFSYPYEIDERVAWHGPQVRGFAPSNCYLLTEGDYAFLVDTGLTVHRELLIEGLSERISDQTSFAIGVLRQGEFDDVCNVIALLDRFDVDLLYGQFDDLPGWCNITTANSRWLKEHPESERPETIVLRKRDEVPFLPGRKVIVRRPVLRLLNTLWLFDEGSGCLFTSDLFSYGHRATADGPWTIDASNDEVDYELVRDHMLSTRYWWLPGADVAEIRSDLASIFEENDVRMIAPTHGCPIVGKESVERHYQLMDDLLRREGRSE